jgi:hypothetical protein
MKNKLFTILILSLIKTGYCHARLPGSPAQTTPPTPPSELLRPSTTNVVVERWEFLPIQNGEQITIAHFTDGSTITTTYNAATGRSTVVRSSAPSAAVPYSHLLPSNTFGSLRVSTSSLTSTGSIAE